MIRVDKNVSPIFLVTLYNSQLKGVVSIEKKTFMSFRVEREISVYEAMRLLTFVRYDKGLKIIYQKLS